MESDIEDIKNVYANRKADESIVKRHQNVYSNYITLEREALYSSVVRNKFIQINNLKVLEIGAGTGANLSFFHRLGIPYSNIYANELINDRVVALKQNFPEVIVFEGNAEELNTNQKYDIVFQSTVFTSLLNDKLRFSAAKKMWNLVNEEGIILWYDFVFNNPTNLHVKKVTKKEIKHLFPKAKKYEFYKVTLAPPIGRKVKKMYNFFNKFKFLRTHIVAVIHK